MALTDNLVSYWKLDETSGNRADSHGSNTLTDNNTVGHATGKIGNGADFISANNEYLSNTGLSYGDADYSFSVWVYIDTSKAFDQCVFSKENSSTERQYRLDYANTIQKLRWFVFTSAGGVAGEVDSATLTTGWHFVVVYHNASANQIGISVDNATFVTTSTSGTISTSTAPFRIGTRFVSGTTPTDNLDETLDEIGHWSRVLTQSEVTQLYNAGAGLTYPFPSGFTPHIMWFT